MYQLTHILLHFYAKRCYPPAYFYCIPGGWFYGGTPIVYCETYGLCCRFLFEVLMKEASEQNLAFQVGLWALELPRQPAATRFLEVQMNWRESEMVALLKRVNLGAEQTRCLRDKAAKLKAGQYAARHCPVLPFSLAQYVFDCLSARQVLFVTITQLGRDRKINITV